MSFGRQLLKLPPLSFIISSNFFFLPGFIIGAETETSIIGSRREKELFFLPLFLRPPSMPTLLETSRWLVRAIREKEEREREEEEAAGTLFFCNRAIDRRCRKLTS
jgi:hypothetical protein